MNKDIPILCCRIFWMSEYCSREERSFSYHRYIQDGNPPEEALNFRKGDDGLYRGYVPVGDDAHGNHGKINIERLGGAKKDEGVAPVLVVFCAPHEQKGGLRIVGFYRNATVLRKPELSDRPNQTKIARVISKDAILIPEAERLFEIPGRQEGGFGQSSLWYGLDDKHQLRDEVLSYVQDTTSLPEAQSSVTENRLRKIHERWEGRGQSRRLIYEKGFCCEACGYQISESDWPTWGSGFELHHLQPWADLQEGEERSLSANDFAVLCATCHRAIHRTEYISDVETFCKKVLAKRNA
ncbi:MAG: HNH endonuclease [Pseudoruegeria sp.]